MLFMELFLIIVPNSIILAIIQVNAMKLERNAINRALITVSNLDPRNFDPGQNPFSILSIFLLISIELNKMT